MRLGIIYNIGTAYHLCSRIKVVKKKKKHFFCTYFIGNSNIERIKIHFILFHNDNIGIINNYN